MIAVIGFAGAWIVLGSYLLAIMSNDTRIFHAGNVIGSVLLCISNAGYGAWPAFVLSAAFGVLGLAGLFAHTVKP